MRVRGELIALLAIVAFIVAMIVVAHPERVGVATPVSTLARHSSYNTTPEGYLALYLALRELGYHTGRHIRPYPLLPKRGLLIVADAGRKQISEYEARQLLKWVAAGNHVLMLSEYNFALGNALRGREPGDEDTGDTWLVEIPGAPPYTGSTPFTGHNATTTVARPVIPSFLSASAPELAVSSWFRLPEGRRFPEDIAKRLGGVAPLYRDQYGTAVAYSAIGKGGIVWCSSPWSFSNAGINKGHNLEFLLALANLQPDAPVLFDEYHQGYGADMGVWALAPPLTKLGIAQLALGFVLLLATLAWRFGTPRLPAEERFTRSRAEYLTSMAGLLQRAGATHVVRERLHVLLRRELSRRLGLSPYARPEELLAANQRQLAVDHAALTRILHQLQVLDEQPRPAPDAVLRLSSEIHRLLRRG